MIALFQSFVRWTAKTLKCMALILAIHITSAASANAQTPIRANVTNVSIFVEPQLTPQTEPKLKVVFRFRAANTTSTRAWLPTEFGGQGKLWEHLHAFQVSGGTLIRDSSGVIIISHRPRARIKISYLVESAFGADPDVSEVMPKLFRPMIYRDKFAVLGGAIFIRLPIDPNAPISFSWGKGPANWSFASDLEHPNLRVGALGNSVLIGGQSLSNESSPDGRTKIAILGLFDKYGSSAIAADFFRIASTQRAFWPVQNEMFLMSLMTIKPAAGTQFTGGLGLEDAFSGWGITDTEPKDLIWLMAHEHLHVWFPRQLGGFVQGKDVTFSMWFSEGFTNYYSNKTLLNSGHWNIQDWLHEWNKVISEHHSSPTRLFANSKIEAEFWRGGEVGQLPYRRGALLAVAIDRKIAQETNGQFTLDDVIRRMRIVASTLPNQTAPGGAPSLLVSLTKELTGVDISGLIESIAINGSDVFFPSEGWGRCLIVKQISKASFSVGFDREKTSYADRVATAVDPNGPAFAAGLRDGMKLVERLTGELGNPDEILTYKVETTPGQIQTLSWMPRGPFISTQTLSLGPDLEPSAGSEARGACMKLLAG